MHNTALAVNSAHKIRFAQDLALYNLTLTEEIEGFDGAAHVEAWNSDAEWQGARKVSEALTAVEDDWGEAIFATNVVFEPLIGELFRSNLVMQSAAGQRRLRDPDRHGRRRVRLRPARPALDDRLLRPARRRTASSPTTTRQLMQGWLTQWVPQALEAARTMQPLWSQPDAQAAALRGQPRPGQEPVRRDLPRSRSRHPRGAEAVTAFKTAESPFKSEQHRVEHVRLHPDEQPGRRAHRRGAGAAGQRQGRRTCRR